MDPSGSRPRLSDVAHRAGVSVPTASRALSGLGRVSEETRERVLQAAQDLDYRPDPSARSLRLGRSRLVGLVVGSYRPDERLRPETLFWQAVLDAAAHQCAARGYGLVVIPPGDVALMRSLPLDGIAVVSVVDDASTLAAALALGVPVLGNDQSGARPPLTVDVDRPRMIRDCLDYLVSAGARRPGVLTFAADVVYSGMTTSAHAQWQADREVVSPLMHVDLADSSGLRRAAVALADGGCDAILTEVPDGLAVIEALAQTGRAVPEDVQVLAIQEPSPEAVARGLSTVSRSPGQLARDAVDALIEAIEGRLELPAVAVTSAVITGRESTRSMPGSSTNSAVHGTSVQ